MQLKPIPVVLPVLAVIALIVTLYPNTSALPALSIDADHSNPTLPANGVSTVSFRVPGVHAKARIVEGAGHVRLERIHFSDNSTLITMRAGVLPGRSIVEAAADGFQPARVEFQTVLETADSFQDGTPDFLRLDGLDQQAFRGWFTLLAESIYYKPPDQLPLEIVDCAALLRFSFREALREHDGTWASGLLLDVLPSLPAIEKYQYPYTPLASGMFRIRPGEFTAGDLSDGAFAQFADAANLRRYNTHFVSRTLEAAKPGDLLFYRQLEQSMPNHAMIFLGSSQFDPDSRQWIVYHTGPAGSSKGEMRRPSTDDLLNHREPRWRPVPANSNFLGVYRWNILR